MKKVITFIPMLLLICNSVSAISLKDLVSTETVESVVTAVTGGTTLSATSLTGTWKYSSSAVKLTSDSTLTELAGSVATSQVESKLDSALAKVGISSGLMSFTFGSDMSFSCTAKSKTLSGTYTVNSDDTITLNFQAVGTLNLGSITSYTELTSSTLKLLFDADKLMSIVDAVSSVSGSSSLETINSLLQNYDGVLVGFDFTK